MHNFWLSWYHDPAFSAFELHSPWWISGEQDDGTKSIVAAVKAASAHEARNIILRAYDDLGEKLQFRFCCEKPSFWDPFGELYPRAEWMIWG